VVLVVVVDVKVRQEQQAFLVKDLLGAMVLLMHQAEAVVLQQ
jgi:hypothetical protein